MSRCSAWRFWWAAVRQRWPRQSDTSGSPSFQSSNEHIVSRCNSYLIQWTSCLRLSFSLVLVAGCWDGWLVAGSVIPADGRPRLLYVSERRRRSCPFQKQKIGNLVLLVDHQVRGLLMPKVTIGSHFSISFALSSPPPAVRRHYLSVRWITSVRSPSLFSLSLKATDHLAEMNSRSLGPQFNRKEIFL